MTEEEYKKVVQAANVERAFVATVMHALDYYIDNMKDNCRKNGLKIESFEANQLMIIQKAIRNITIDYRTISKNKSKAFKDYAKIMAVTLQELFSRTDGDYMTMYKFYNYIKAFKTQNRFIEVPAEVEQDAFRVVFSQDTEDEDNRTES